MQDAQKSVYVTSPTSSPTEIGDMLDAPKSVQTTPEAEVVSTGADCKPCVEGGNVTGDYRLSTQERKGVKPCLALLGGPRVISW